MGKDRVMPHSVEIEMALLGALMLDPDKLATVSQIVSRETFYLDQHRDIYQAMVDLKMRGLQPDLPSVLDEIKRQGQLDKCGGAGFLASLLSAVASSAHVESHATLIAQKHAQRRLIRACTEIVEAGYQQELAHDELMDLAEKAIFDITRLSAQASELTHIGQSLAGLFEQTVNAHTWRKENADPDGNLPTYHAGLTTNFLFIDEYLDGYLPGTSNLISGMPGCGKSALVLNIAANIARRPAHKVILFSLEMGAVALARRMVSAHTEIEKEKIQRADMDDDEWVKFQSATRYLSGNLLMIGDTGTLTLRQLMGTIRRNYDDLKLVMVDSLNLMTPVGNYSGKTEMMESLSIGLKQIARETGIPIVAITQEDKASMKAKSEPALADLKGTASLGYDCDTAILVFRDPKDAAEEVANRPQKYPFGIVPTYIKIAKNREGRAGKKLMLFDKRVSKFKERE